MSPEELQRLEKIEEVLSNLMAIDRIKLQKNIQIFDARNIQLGVANGTKIGTKSTQKLAFYGITPIVQQNAITKPSGGATIDSQTRTAINSIIDFLTLSGLTQ